MRRASIIDGDQLMALIALGLQRRGELKGDAVVATVMSNLGLERKLGDAGLKLLRTKVGDRYVLEEMRKSGCNVGGEQSGHIILADHATTGDGLVAGLAGACRARRGGSARERAPAPVRTAPAASQERAFQRRRGAAEGRQRPETYRRGRSRARGPRASCHPQIGHRATDPRDGGRRRRSARPRVVDDICEAVQSAA